ncbi:MAG: regulatory protein RecX [Actinomycetota bacterium]|nr:regulatory protein RecX [Actinomycetota bacterium]
MIPENSDYEKAYKKAISLLSRRMQSCGEIRQKLRRAGYSVDDVETVVEKLRESGLLDDLVFAKTYIEELVRKGYGYNRVRQSLFNKRLAKEDIENSISLYYPMEEEEMRAFEQAKKHIHRYDSDSSNSRTKLYAALNRLGYDGEIATKVSGHFVDTKENQE